MLPELGQLALLLALLVAALQALLPLVGAQRGLVAWMAVARPAAYAQLLLVLAAFAILTAGFVGQDFSIRYVAENSNSLLPWFYRFTAVWGAHEGSLLLWALILALWTGASKQQLGREFIESLARGLTVLTAFGEGRPELTLTEVSQATGLARATARRALITYEHLGLVAAAGRTFTLTPRVLSLGFPPLSRTSLPEIAQPHLADLTSRIHESTSLAVLSDSGEEIQYTARVATARVMSVNITVGTRLPAYATALGRVLLADASEGIRGARDLPPLTARTVTDKHTLEEILTSVRAQGYALVDEELEEGLRSIAVPIRDRSGRVVAALNTAMHASRRTPRECVTDLVPELTATAARIRTDLHTAARFTHVPLT